MSYEKQRYETIHEELNLVNIKDMVKASPQNWTVAIGLPVIKIKNTINEKGEPEKVNFKTDIPRAIWLNAIVINLISGDEYFEISFVTDMQEIKTARVPRTIMNGTASSPEVKSLTRVGAPVGTNNFKTFVDLLMDYTTNTIGVETKYGVDQFGWYGKGMNFIVSKPIGDDPELIQLQADNYLNPFKPKGDYALWLKMFKEAVIDHYDGNTLFACSYALSSLLKGVLSRDFEFIPALLIYGQSGLGKSTVQYLIASMAGRAGLLSKNEGIILTFNSTLNALQFRMASLGPIPCIVDEKSLEKETQGRKMVLDDILYTINTGIKDRLDGSSMPTNDCRPVECSLILSGEASEDLSGNSGKQYRLVQQLWTGFKGETDGSLAESIKNTVSRNSGFFLPVFIQHMIDKKDNLESTYQLCTEHSRAILKEAGIKPASISRMTPNLARARLSCLLMLSAMMLETEIITECLKAFDDTAIDIYSRNIVRTEFERIPERLAEGLAVNSNKFSVPVQASGNIKSKYTDPPTGEIWGRFFDSGTIGVYPRYLTELVNHEFSSPQIREVIKRLGGKRTGIKVKGRTSYMWCFKLPDYVNLNRNKKGEEKE